MAKSDSKCRAKKRPATDEVKFSTYIAKAHKKLHGDTRVIVSASALESLDRMTDTLINALVSNGRRTMRYSKTETFNLRSAAGATMLTLTGILKTETAQAGQTAVEKYKRFATVQ